VSIFVRPTARLCCLVLVWLTVGCYSLQPTGGVTPPLGTTIGLELNDVGRVALGGSMGPAIGRVEGRLVSRDSSEYVVAVTDVHLLDGGDQVWSGETVHIKSAYVSSVFERKLSVARSVALGAAGVGAAALIATASLTGFGSTDRPNSSGDTSQTNRIPQRIPQHFPQRIPQRIPRP
jgi:hypothetical protein